MIILGEVPPLRHCTASRLGHSPPVFLWKRLFCSSPGGRPQVWHMSSGLQSYSRGTEVISPLSLCLAPAHQCLTEECLYSCQEPWFLQLPRGHLQIAWLWCHEGLCLWSHWTVYTCILLKAASEGLTSSQPDFRCWYCPLWGHDRSWYILK